MHVSYLKCVTQRNCIDTESSSSPFCHRQTSLTKSVSGINLTWPSWLWSFGCMLAQGYTGSFWQVTCRVTLRSAVWAHSLCGFCFGFLVVGLFFSPLSFKHNFKLLKSCAESKHHCWGRCAYVGTWCSTVTSPRGLSLVLGEFRLVALFSLCTEHLLITILHAKMILRPSGWSCFKVDG